MAGKKLKTRVPASSILEVIISMVIIIAVFGIVMMIYANVTRLSLSGKKIRAEALLRQTLLEAEHSNTITSRSLLADDFRIDQEISIYNDDSNLTEIHLTAYDQNQQKVAELKKIIISGP